jgi:DNA-binding NarL/FixJ family response regulator
MECRLMSRASEIPRILLVDDHPAVRFGLEQLLSLDKQRIFSTAGHREEMQQQLDAGPVDLAIIDLNLGRENGLDLIEDLRILNIPVLVYSMHEDARTIRLAFARGAQAYVCKREDAKSLLDAVNALLTGISHISPLAAQRLACEAIDSQQMAANVDLSEREKQIIALLGQGRTNTEIGELLSISIRTVESYCARAIEKLGLAGMKELRRHAIQYALEHGHGLNAPQ